MTLGEEAPTRYDANRLWTAREKLGEAPPAEVEEVKGQARHLQLKCGEESYWRCFQDCANLGFFSRIGRGMLVDEEPRAAQGLEDSTTAFRAAV